MEGGFDIDGPGSYTLSKMVRHVIEGYSPERVCNGDRTSQLACGQLAKRRR